MMHADKTKIAPDMFPFSENSDKHGILRDAMPDRSKSEHQAARDFTSGICPPLSSVSGWQKKPLLILFV
jgi:hypothetical protein